MSLTAVHEFNEHQQHRIVLMADDGTNQTSSWFHLSEIAHLRDIYACASAEHPIPIGIFKVREQAHQVLA